MPRPLVVRPRSPQPLRSPNLQKLLPRTSSSVLNSAIVGRPGDRKAARPERSDCRFHLFIAALSRRCDDHLNSLNTSRSSTLSGWWRRASSLRWAASATVMTMLSPKRSTSLQGRDHSSTRAMAVIRCRRVRDAGMGGLVQQPAALGAHRQHPAGRSRGTLLRHAGTPCHGGVTQTKWPPTNPGRFRPTKTGC